MSKNLREISVSQEKAGPFWSMPVAYDIDRIRGRIARAIAPAERDFRDRLLSERHLQSMFQALASQMSAWLRQQTLFPLATNDIDLERDIAAFYGKYLNSPFRLVLGESRFNNCLWLHVLAKAMKPEVIIDSGSFTGASAWTLSHGNPDARVISFDIDLSNLRLRVPGVQYVQGDWTTFDMATVAGKRVLCYFDDHVDQARRLIEARDRGVGLAIFDDDFTIGAFPPMAHDGRALPKIEFVLDESLVDGDVIVWTSGGRRKSFVVDRAYLDKARSVIFATERLPNTSNITGIQQTPYRIVALKPP